MGKRLLKFFVGLILVFFTVSYFNLRVPTLAAPVVQLTPFPTPTPGPDGRIIYVVQDNDTLWRIAAISEIPIDELRRMNNLSADDLIRPGQVLLLGLGGPSDPATPLVPNPTPDSESSLPTPTPGMGTGTVCILLFEDVNGDALRQPEEVGIPDGAASLTNRAESVSRTIETDMIATADGPVPPCIEDLPQGDYNVTVAVPEGYNPTTVLNYGFNLQAGNEIFLDFGAQLNSEATEQEVPADEGGQSPILGIIGVLLLLGGVVLAVFAGRLSRGGKSRFSK